MLRPGEADRQRLVEGRTDQGSTNDLTQRHGQNTDRGHAPIDRPHVAANVGRTAAECWAIDTILDRAGADIDAAPSAVDLPYALQLRQLVAAGCQRVESASRRATGPGPYVFDDRHAQRIDDLALYIEQQHYEADLGEVGDDALRRHRRT